MLARTSVSQSVSFELNSISLIEIAEDRLSDFLESEWGWLAGSPYRVDRVNQITMLAFKPDSNERREEVTRLLSSIV